MMVFSYMIVNTDLIGRISVNTGLSESGSLIGFDAVLENGHIRRILETGGRLSDDYR